MKERIFTATEICHALCESRKEIAEMVCAGVITPDEGSNRRIGVLEVAEFLGLENAYEEAFYQPQPDAGKDGDKGRTA